MRTVAKVLIRWSWLVLLCLLVGYFGGKKLATLLPPTYAATALVQLNTQSRGSQVIQPVAAYAALVTSDPVVNPILLQHPDLDRQTFVSKQLVVNSDSLSQTITIQVTLAKARDAMDIANNLAQLLVAQQNAFIASQYNKELQILVAHIADEQKTIAQLNQQLTQTPATSTAEIQQLDSQISQQQGLENQDISNRQALLTEQALYSTPFSIVQAATLPNKPASIIGAIPVAPVTMVLLIALALAVVGLFEQRAGRIDGTYTVQQKASLPVLGSLRWTKPDPEEVSLATLVESRTPYAEECRVMMADVLYHAEEAHAHILAVAGLRGNAGSSTIASQLAMLLAQSKRRVLLIDANFHEPTLHKRLRLPNNVGLGDMLEELRTRKVTLSTPPPLPKPGRTPDVLRQSPPSLDSESATRNGKPGSVSMAGRRPPGRPYFLENIRGSIRPAQTPKVSIEALRQDAVQGNGTSDASHKPADQSDREFPYKRYITPTAFQNLYLLPAGQSKRTPSSLISMPEMSEFLRWVADPIEFVIIDCPALLNAEAHIIGSLSDQTLLVVDATRDRLPQVVNARKELLNTGVKLTGFIVNKLGRLI